MDDLANMLSQVLSNPDAMQQIQSVAAALGLGDNSDNAAGTAPPSSASVPQGQPAPDAGGLDLSAFSALLGSAEKTQPAAAPAPTQGSLPDLSALASLLGGAGGQQPAQPQQQGSLPDLSALASLLGGVGGQQPAQPQQQGSSPDLSALSGMLGGLLGENRQGQSGGGDVAALASLLNAGNPPRESPPSSPFDMSTLLKLQKAMSSLSANQSNVQLLMALKPRLKPGRAKKVDDAVRVMQLIQFLPLIKETGLFGDMESLLGKLGGGGLGNLVGGLGGGLSGVLGNLLGGGRR